MNITYTVPAEQRMADDLRARWADHEDRQLKDAPILHIYEDGVEIGNIPLDSYGGPVGLAQPVADWARLNGRKVEPISKAVTVFGTYATHYGVTVVDVVPDVRDVLAEGPYCPACQSQPVRGGVSMTTATLALIPDGCRMALNVGELVEQIGRDNYLSVCGGRARAPKMPHEAMPFRLELHCGNGYRVYIYLHASDTYIVQRVYRRGSKEWIKGEQRDVYADQVGEVVYRAGMFRDNWR